MTQATTPLATSAPKNAPSRGTRLHTIIACVLLVMLGLFWWVGAKVFRLALIKQPVRWTDVAKVDEGFRLTSLPERLGNFEMVREDGVFRNETGQVVLDGKPDGDNVYDAFTLESLGIGSAFDKTRYASRCSNWYVSRVYRDTREPEGSSYRYWQMDITYYTGALEQVPHVPERCLLAAGATLTGDHDVVMQAGASLPNGWGKPFTVRRTGYEQVASSGQTRAGAQYFMFSLNGEPESSWVTVRRTLGFPWVTHSYFAKIQFAPWGVISDVADADRHAQQFLVDAMPGVLGQLPMAQDLKR